MTAGDYTDEFDPDELAKITELEEFWPERVDLVINPANGYPPLLLKAVGQGPRITGRVVKDQAERRYTLMVAYPAGKPDVSVAADGWRDFAQADAVEQAAWQYMLKHRGVGLMHMPGTDDAGQVCESYLYRGPRWVVKAADGSEQVVEPGDWLLGVIWGRAAWDMIKEGRAAGRPLGMSMQGSAQRRKPSPEALAGLRKKAEGDVVMALRKAAKRAVKTQAGALRKEAKSLRKELAKLGPRCGSGHANAPGARFCRKCGVPVSGLGLVKSTAVVDVPRQLDLIKRARSADPETRDRALATLLAEHGPAYAAQVISGDLTVRGMATALVKSEAAAVEAEHPHPCRTCGGRGRLLHLVTGEKSKKCPACGGSGLVAAGEAPHGPDEAGVAKLARLAARALAGDADCLAKLLGEVGPLITARLMAQEPVSAEEFTRGYIAAGRARLSAASDQTPRVPQATHVVRPSDFTRGPLPPPQSRPAPGSQWPGSGGQQSYYGPGMGTGVAGAYAGLGDTGTSPTSAAPATRGL